MNMIMNKAFIVALSTGLVDEMLKLNNSDVIATSLIGSETYAFTQAILEKRPDWKITAETSRNNTGRSDEFVLEIADEQNSIISLIQILGVVMFMLILLGVTILQIVAKEKMDSDDEELPIADPPLDEWSFDDMSFETDVQSKDSSKLSGVSWN